MKQDNLAQILEMMLMHFTKTKVASLFPYSSHLCLSLSLYQHYKHFRKDSGFPLGFCDGVSAHDQTIMTLNES